MTNLFYIYSKMMFSSPLSSCMHLKPCMYSQPTPSPTLPPPQPPLYVLPHTGAPATHGVPIHMLSMPASPSPIPSYVMASMGAPQYTMTMSPTPLGAAGVPLPATFHQPYSTGVNFGGIDGLGPYGSVQGGRGQFEGAMSHDTAPPSPGQGPGLRP
jgi:hypothetical protein